MALSLINGSISHHGDAAVQDCHSRPAMVASLGTVKGARYS